MDLAHPWLDKWRIRLNANKTVLILFGDRLANDIQEINVHGNTTRWQTIVKYLVVHFDRSLKFYYHVTETCTCPSGVRAAFYLMINQSNLLPNNTKILIYKMYIKSIFTYAGPAWGVFIFDRHWTNIRTIQNVAIRMITNTP